MCIGGELEHQKALPLSSRKKQSTSGVICSLARGIYSQIIGPESWLEPVLKATLSFRFQPRTGTMVVGQEQGPSVPVRVWNRVVRVQTNRDQCPTRPARPPRCTNRDVCPHGSRFVAEPVLMG